MLARGEQTRGVSPFEDASSRFFLHVDQSAWGGTLVNSLLRVYGLLHRHSSKQVKRKKTLSALCSMRNAASVKSVHCCHTASDVLAFELSLPARHHSIVY